MPSRFDKHLATLHPQFRDAAARFLADALAAGLDPRVQEGYRTRERQAQLYAQGRTAPGAIVTKALPGRSNHNYGVALDVVPGAVLSHRNWNPESPLWVQLGEIGQRHGLEWGGNWKFVDKPHFQLAGASWRRMQNDPVFADWRPDGTAPTAQNVATAYTSPGTPPDIAAASGVPGAPPALASMFGSETGGQPGGTMLGNFATNYLQQYSARLEQRRQEEEADQARREALLGLSLDALYA